MSGYSSRPTFPMQNTALSTRLPTYNCTCLPSAEFCFGIPSMFSFSPLSCCILSVLGTSDISLASSFGLTETKVVAVASGVAKLWDPGREVLPLVSWPWLVLLVVVGVLGGLSSLCCFEPKGDWLLFFVAVSRGLSSGIVSAGSSAWLAVLPTPSGAFAPDSTCVMVSTDSVDVPEDLSRRTRSSLDACSSSRMGDSSDSVKTSSETEPSVLRGAVLPLSLAPESLRRFSRSFCWEGCRSGGRGSRSLKTLKTDYEKATLMCHL